MMEEISLAEEGEAEATVNGFQREQGQPPPPDMTFQKPPEQHPPPPPPPHMSTGPSFRRRYLPSCPQSRRLRSLCGYCSKPEVDVSMSPIAVNKILPVTMTPNQFDFLEIRPTRRVRVIHLYGAVPPLPEVTPQPRMKLSSSDAKSHCRKASTMSRV